LVDGGVVVAFAVVVQACFFVGILAGVAEEDVLYYIKELVPSEFNSPSTNSL